MAELVLSEIVRLVGGVLQGSGNIIIRGVAPIEAAAGDQISFVANSRYEPYVATTGAAAVILPHGSEATAPETAAVVRVDDPNWAITKVLRVLHPDSARSRGVHPSAIVGDSVDIAESASIGAYAVIGTGVKIGEDVQIGTHCVIGDGCTVGQGSVLHSQVTLYPDVLIGKHCIIHSGARLGGDGFGYVFAEGEHQKVPQIGRCEIGDRVEIGCNSTIDRGSIGNTVIGAGTKIDNLVHIGHNARIGSRAILIAQVGVSGSTVVGDGVILAGQAGISGHLTIGAGARVAAQAGVIGDVAPGTTVSGYPARPHREALRAQAVFFRLPELLSRVRDLERRIRELPPTTE